MGSKKTFKYKVKSNRIGKEVGSIVEYDHEPCAEFLACLEDVNAELVVSDSEQLEALKADNEALKADKTLEVATPSDGDVTTQSTQQRPKRSRI